MAQLRERRAFTFEPDTRSADAPSFGGIAAVFDTITDLGPFRERVAPSAFTKTIKDGADVRLLVNHDGVPLARTKSGTLGLEATELGLRAFTPEDKPLDAANPRVQEVRSAMNRGDLDQMSFAFQTVKDEWDDDPEDGGKSIRTIREAKLFDVSVVTYPAYEETTAEIRSQAEHVLASRATEPPPEPADDTSDEAVADHSAALARARSRNANRKRRLSLAS